DYSGATVNENTINVTSPIASIPNGAQPHPRLHRQTGATRMARSPRTATVNVGKANGMVDSMTVEAR
ncbi:MAG: hypothetical protein WD358_01510, partial [Nitriliruptoraceae bacterium]